MITIFKNRKDIPQDMEYVELNDIYFNQNTAAKIDDRAKYIIETIEKITQDVIDNTFAVNVRGSILIH